MDRKYYLVDPNGKSMEAIKEWQRMKIAAIEAAKNIALEFGADTEVITRGNFVAAFQFKSDPGRAWRPISKIGEFLHCYTPDLRKKAGKAIFNRLSAIRMPGSEDFAKLIGGGFFIVCGNQWGSISFQKFDDKYVISMPIGDRDNADAAFVPPDTTPLKLSEYYALKGE